MVSSAQIPFDERVIIVDAVKLIEVEFFHYTLGQRDEIIDEQRLEIRRLKRANNKLKQRREK